jgi:hypothetical protein
MFSPLKMLEEEYLENINPHKNKIKNNVNIQESLFLRFFNDFLNNTTDPVKNNQNITGIFLINGPKL